MAQTAHTPEPSDGRTPLRVVYRYSRANETPSIVDRSGWEIARRVCSFAMADRITACVNACEGISTEALEKDVVKALVTACKIAFTFDWKSGEGASAVYAALEAALALAKGA